MTKQSSNQNASKQTGQSKKEVQSQEYGVQKNNFIQVYFATILQIIEDKPNFLIPVSLYCLLIVIYYLQLSGYIFSHYESKALTEPKFGFIAYLNEVSPVTFLLYMKGHDTLTLVCYLIMQFTMYFYFTYVGVYGYLQTKHKFLVLKYKRLFSTINQLLNVFFTFYWWIFFTPYIEINSGIIVCGGNSFLVEYREIEEGQACGKPAYLYILGILGLILSVITGLIVIFFFRCYEFDEGNLLKRRYNFLLVLQLFTRFMTTFFYYLNIDIVLVFKHVAAQFVGLSLMYDIYQNWPFRSIIVSKFYLISTMFFWWAMTVVAIWMFTDEFPDTVLFYPYVVLGVVFSGGFMALYNQKYDKIMKFEQKNFANLYYYTDFYLEEMQRLLRDSLKSEYSKCRMFEIITYHKDACIDQNCACKYLNFWNQQDELDIENVYRFIDSIFKWALHHPILRKNRDEYEHLSLKYISYLCKFRNNSNRAYLELKLLLSNRSDVSFYFQTISKILSQNIEFMMEQMYTKEVGVYVGSTELDASILLSLQQFKLQTIPQFVEYLSKKIKFWDEIKHGYQNLEQFLSKSLQLAKLGEKLRKQLEFQLNNFEHKQNIIYLRIQSFYYCLLQKEMSTAWKSETQILEIKKRDIGKAFDVISNLSLSKGYIINLVISMAMSQGRIQNKISPKIANFFGYSAQEFEQIKNVNQLMPPFLKNDHNEIMDNMVNRGKSIMIKSKLSNFAFNKNKFIVPVYVYLDHSFQWANDFCINATLLKVVDGVNYILFNNKGMVEGISEALFDEIFQTKDIKQNNQKSDKQNDEDEVHSHKTCITKKEQDTNKSPQFKMMNTNKMQQISTKIGTSKVQQKQNNLINVQYFYQSVLLPFIIPQLLKVFQEWENILDPRQRYFQEQIIAQQSCRIKVPNQLQDLQQDCLQQINNDQFGNSTNASIFQGQQSSVNSKKFKQQSNYMSATSQFSKNITNKQNNFDFQNKDILTQASQFIINNRNYYKTQNCMVDFSCKIDVFVNNIIFGKDAEKNIMYYILHVKELHPAKDQTDFETAKTNSMWMTAGETTNFKSMGLKTKKSSQGENTSQMYQVPSQFPSLKGSEKEKNIGDQLIGKQLIESQKKQIIPDNPQDNSQLQSNYQEKIINNNNVSALNQIDQSNRQLLESQNVTPLQSPTYRKQQNQDQTDRNYLLQNNNIESMQITPAPTITDRNNEIMTTDRNNNFLNSYKAHDNQVQKDGELSVLPSPDISMIEQTQPDQQMFTPRYENVITDVSNSFAPNNHTNENNQIPTAQSEENPNNGKNVNKFQDNQQIQEQEDEYEYDDENEELDKQKNKDLVASLFQETSHYKNNKECKEDQDESDNNSQKRMEENIGSFLDVQNQKKSEKKSKNQEKQDQDMNQINNNNSKKGNLNIEILNELFSSNQKPRSFLLFQKLLCLFIITFIILDLIFVIFYIKQFNTLYDKTIIQNYPYMLNEYYQQASIAGIGLLEIVGGVIKDEHAIQKQEYFIDQFDQAQKGYIEQKEQFFQHIYEIQEEYYKDLYTISIYSDNTFKEQQLTLAQFLDLISVELMAENQLVSSKEHGQGFYTIIANQKIHRDLTSEITNLYGDLIIQQQENIFSNFMNFTFIVFGVFVIILICQIPQVKRLINYQERILILVTRLYEFESQIEINKLNHCLEELQSLSEDWINVNFVDILLTDEFKYLKHDTSKQAVLTGKIKTQNLNLIKWILALVMMCLFLTLFFVILIIIVAYINVDTEPSIKLNTKCYQNTSDITALITISELLIVEPLLYEIDPTIQQLDRSSNNAYLKEIRENINKFTANFQRELDECTILSDQSVDQIYQIFNNNICEEIECVDVYEDVNYNSGLVAIMNFYTKNIIEQEKLLNAQYDYTNFVQVDNTVREEIMDYLNSHSHLEFILKGYKTAIPSQLKISEILQEENLNIIKDVELICWIYFLALGSFMSFLWIIIYNLIVMFVYNRIKQMHFLLTVIPYDKLSEDATIYLLKNISNI